MDHRVKPGGDEDERSVVWIPDSQPKAALQNDDGAKCPTRVRVLTLLPLRGEKEQGTCREIEFAYPPPLCGGGDK